MSFNRKPSNWYDMSYEAQQEWKRHDRAAEDEHYARIRAENDAAEAREDARARESRLRQAMASEVEQMQYSIDEANRQLAEALEHKEELLAALRGLMTLSETLRKGEGCMYDPYGNGYMKSARAAIAKAEGSV